MQQGLFTMNSATAIFSFLLSQLTFLLVLSNPTFFPANRQNSIYDEQRWEHSVVRCR